LSRLSFQAPGKDQAYVDFNERPQGGHRMMLALVPDGSRVLDIGCSSGYLASRLVARGCRVTGIEADPEAAARARTVCEEVLVGDVETLDLAGLDHDYDVVVCGDLIEHLRDPGRLLARLREHLRPGGRVVLTTPNIANWTIRLRLLFGRFEYQERGILDRTHTHLFTRKSLLRTLADAGYRPVVVDHTAPVPVLDGPRVERLAHAIAKLRPGLLAFQFVVAAQRD